MTEKHPVDRLGQRERTQKREGVIGQAPAHEVHQLGRRTSRLLLHHLAVGVTANEADVAFERRQTLVRLRRPRPGDEVAADENHVRVDFREHRIEGRQIAVDVVERCDSH